jgi:hypothetical protein
LQAFHTQIVEERNNKPIKISGFFGEMWKLLEERLEFKWVNNINTCHCKTEQKALSWCRAPNRILFSVWQLPVSLRGAPSLMRGWVCNLLVQLLLGLSRAVEVEVEVNLQAVSQSVLVSVAHLGPVTNLSFSLKFTLASSYIWIQFVPHRKHVTSLLQSNAVKGNSRCSFGEPYGTQTLCGQNTELKHVEVVVHIVTTGSGGLHWIIRLLNNYWVSREYCYKL